MYELFKLYKSNFFERGELENTKAELVVREALDGMDDGELFLEYCQSEGITFDDGKENANYDTMQGFGLALFKVKHQLMRTPQS